MLKKKIGVAVLALVLTLGACKSPLDVNIGFEIKATWQLFETCLSAGCLPADPDPVVTIQFRGEDLIQKSNDQIIGASAYTISEIQKQDDVTLYALLVDNSVWRLTVTETRLDIVAGGVLRKYNKVE